MLQVMLLFSHAPILTFDSQFCAPNKFCLLQFTSLQLYRTTEIHPVEDCFIANAGYSPKFLTISLAMLQHILEQWAHSTHHKSRKRLQNWVMYILRMYYLERALITHWMYLVLVCLISPNLLIVTALLLHKYFVAHQSQNQTLIVHLYY